MANPSVTNILIGFIMLGLIMTGFAVWFADMNSLADNYDSYSVDDFNRSKIDRYNKLSEIQNLTEDMRNDVEEASPGTESENDVIGSFFTNAYTSVKTFFKSSTYAYEITKVAQEDLADAGGNSELLKTTASSIITVTVIIFVGIALFIIFKVRT